jgi:hypothetical protein
MVLNNMIYKLIEIGRSYGMEMNVDKTKVRISRQPFSVKLMIDQNQRPAGECACSAVTWYRRRNC